MEVLWDEYGVNPPLGVNRQTENITSRHTSYVGGKHDYRLVPNYPVKLIQADPVGGGGGSQEAKQ